MTTERPEPPPTPFVSISPISVSHRPIWLTARPLLLLCGSLLLLFSFRERWQFASHFAVTGATLVLLSQLMAIEAAIREKRQSGPQ